MLAAGNRWNDFLLHLASCSSSPSPVNRGRSGAVLHTWGNPQVGLRAGKLIMSFYPPSAPQRPHVAVGSCPAVDSLSGMFLWFQKAWSVLCKLEAVSPALLLGVGVQQVKTCPEIRCVDADFSPCSDKEVRPSMHGWGVRGNCKTRYLP